MAPPRWQTSPACSKPKMAFACFEASDRYPAISCSSVSLLFSVMRTRSACFCVADSACDLSLVSVLAHELLLLLLLELALLAHGVDVLLEVGDRALKIVAVFLNLLLGSLGGSEFSQRGILALSILPASSLARLIRWSALSPPALALLRQVCVVLHRVAEVPLQLGEFIAQAVVVLLGPGRGALLVLQSFSRRFTASSPSLSECCFCLISYVFLEELFQLLHVALHLLLALGLLVRRGPGGRASSRGICSLFLHSQLIRLRRPELLRHLHDLLPEHDDLVHLLVALRREFTALSHHVLQLLLLLAPPLPSARRLWRSQPPSSAPGHSSLARVSFSLTRPPSSTPSPPRP